MDRKWSGILSQGGLGAALFASALLGVPSLPVKEGLSPEAYRFNVDYGWWMESQARARRTVASSTIELGEPDQTPSMLADEKRKLRTARQTLADPEPARPGLLAEFRHIRLRPLFAIRLSRPVIEHDPVNWGRRHVVAYWPAYLPLLGGYFFLMLGSVLIAHRRAARRRLLRA